MRIGVAANLLEDPNDIFDGMCNVQAAYANDINNTLSTFTAGDLASMREEYASDPTPTLTNEQEINLSTEVSQDANYYYVYACALDRAGNPVKQRWEFGVTRFI